NDREIVAADIRLGGRKAKLGVRVPYAISIKYDLETQGAETARWMFNSLKIYFCAAVACELHHIRFQIHEKQCATLHTVAAFQYCDVVVTHAVTRTIADKNRCTCRKPHHASKMRTRALGR